MSDQPAQRTCPDCKGVLQPIKLLDKWGAWGERKVFEELTYTEGDAQQKGFLAPSYKPAGIVHAFMCDSCHRIVLYGSPE
jgi:hypothetical protein